MDNPPEEDLEFVQLAHPSFSVPGDLAQEE